MAVPVTGAPRPRERQEGEKVEISACRIVGAGEGEKEGGTSEVRRVRKRV